MRTNACYSQIDIVSGEFTVPLLTGCDTKLMISEREVGMLATHIFIMSLKPTPLALCSGYVIGLKACRNCLFSTSFSPEQSL